MKKLILATMITAAFAVNFAHAEEAAPAAKPDNEVSFNAALTSDYRYRGYSQSRLQPALQGGADYTNNPTGFYLGTWASTIKWVKDAGGNGNVELDLYGGKRGDIGGGVSYDVGVLQYYYNDNNLNPSANTFEINGKLVFGPAYVKYSHSTTNLFGFTNSKNSGYVDIGAAFDVAEGLSLGLHAGHQTVKNNSAFSYTDWSVGLTKDFGVCSASVTAVGMTSKAYVGPAPDLKNLGKTALVVAISKTF